MTAVSPGPAGPRFGFGLLGPRRGRHELSPEECDALALPVGDDGVVIGSDDQGLPAVLGLGRPVPFDVLLIGSAWTAQVIALRAVATGARVAVETGRRALWSALAGAANSEQQCVTLYDVGRVPPQGPSLHSPVVVLRDCGVRPPRGRLGAAPWQSVVTLLPFPGPTTERLMGRADLVGIQRVSPEEARVLGRAMRLAAQDVEALSTLPEGVTLWCTRTSRTYVATRPTEPEAELLGPARRVD
ncbi:hypothetical protein GCM10010218_64830 [Streptomyces mashuensis]|uniref:Uncharacterized protein n=1 Tax=Streptomyces mashuensis TaxID=33904 RepID=A0A919BB11_9ACTN|nr:hypothetical protein [Streptomyces mashuensis]GHF74795.1 hypothetical protein GCM10010218_64830 [Streptomyces mashuensis]